MRARTTTDSPYSSVVVQCTMTHFDLFPHGATAKPISQWPFYFGRGISRGWEPRVSRAAIPRARGLEGSELAESSRRQELDRKPGLSVQREIRQRLTDDGGELETVPTESAGDRHARLRWVHPEDEVRIG